MANYYASARSNSFRVKDLEKFKDWVNSCSDLGFWIDDEATNTVSIYCDNPDGGGWPSYRYMEEPKDLAEDAEWEEFQDFDLYDELAEHLKKDSVAILMEIGAEKLRYLVGYAIAVDSTGKHIYMSLDEIFTKAQKKFKNKEVLTF